MEIVKNHRSIRCYSDKKIEDGMLEQLIAEAGRTQTMGNLQLYSVVISRDATMRKRLTELHLGQPMVENCAAVVTICADFHRTTAWAEARRANPGYDNILSFMNAATDALLFTQTLSMLCEEKGLGVCFLGTTIYSPGKIAELLKLPELVFPVATLTIGYPAENPAQSDRLPADAIIHNETYKDYTNEDIDKLYGYKENLPENKEFVKINNKETLAQVFTDLRYTRKDNESMSETFVEALKQQGWLK